MLNFLNVESFVNNLSPITSTSYTTKAGDFHTEGLFSELIFGPVGDPERRKKFSYIDLFGYVIHPSAYRVILQLDRKVEKFISTEESFSLDKENKLVIDPKGVTGLKEFMKMFPQINFRGETDVREKLKKLLKREYKRNTIFVNFVPVIPPDLRPATQDETGNWMVDALNDVYVSIMKKATQLQSSGSGPLYDLLNYSLQLAIMEHDNFIRTKIGKKQGIIRDQMLGKRIDFSGRAVITPDPKLDINEVGIPLRMAVNLFEPFIMHRLIYSGRVNKELLSGLVGEHTGMELSTEAIKRVFKSIKEDDKISEELYELFFEQTEAAMHGRVVVVKRDPVLHPQSYMAYNPVLYRGDTMMMSTLNVGTHNADFDGDSVDCIIEYEDSIGDKNVTYISQFNKVEKCDKISEETKSNGTVVKKFKPHDELYIDAVDPKTGNVVLKRITQFSIHENIDMYKISDTQRRFGDFWSSYDHSLIVYDKDRDEIRKISPRELLEQPENKFLIRKKV